MLCRAHVGMGIGVVEGRYGEVGGPMRGMARLRRIAARGWTGGRWARASWVNMLFSARVNVADLFCQLADFFSRGHDIPSLSVCLLRSIGRPTPALSTANEIAIGGGDIAHRGRLVGDFGIHGHVWYLSWSLCTMVYEA